MTHLLFKSNLLKGLTSKDVLEHVDPDIANAYRLFLNAQVIFPLKYLSNFFRLLEMPLLHCKLHLDLNWSKTSVISNIAAATTFQITS